VNRTKPRAALIGRCAVVSDGGVVAEQEDLGVACQRDGTTALPRPTEASPRTAELVVGLGMTLRWGEGRLAGLR
jgi:hypothetical protein